MIEIQLRVLDPEGKPVPGARVMLDSDTFEMQDIAALTDNAGFVRLGVFPNSITRIACVAEGYKASQKFLEVGENQSEEVEIRLRR
ncbi:MAG: carboxypeptidase regulatory-like domain-containing protein [Rhodobacteraceae bacterium]|nr:carboxypeptidase regulatory-like domain-containing protein [Paracoccaceae bacterium]